MREQEIIDLLLRHDEHGMEALLQYYGPLLRYMIASILPDPQDQEDCLSEVLMRVWDKIEQFDHSRGSWNAWLTVLARNAALNRARKAQAASCTQTLPENSASAEPTPEEIVIRREREEYLRHAFMLLSSKERMLIYRKYYYLQSTAQIARELGTTERAVEGKLYRIKKRLRKMLGGDEHV